MLRRTALAGLAAAFAPAAGARGQTAPSRRRIGLITSSTNEPFVAGMIQALRELGLEDGRTLEIVVRDGQGRAELIERAVEDALRANAELLVVWATAAAQAAMRATQRTPIVAQVADALGADIVRSLARPEGNITGVSSTSFDLTGKRVELLLQALPQARTLAFVGLKGEPNVHRFHAFARQATRPGVEQRLIEVTGVEEIEAAVGALRAQLDGMTPQQIFNPQNAALAAAMQRLKLPGCGTHRSFAQAGGLMAIDAVVEESWRRMAHQVQRLLAGAAVSDLPFEQPSRTHTVINLRAAASLGLALPPTLLGRADEVIE